MGGTWPNSIPAFRSAEGNHVVVLRKCAVAQTCRNGKLGTDVKAGDVCMGDHCDTMHFFTEGPWCRDRVHMHRDGDTVHCWCTNSMDGDNDWNFLSCIARVDCLKFSTAKSILRIC